MSSATSGTWVCMFCKLVCIMGKGNSIWIMVAALVLILCPLVEWVFKRSIKREWHKVGPCIFTLAFGFGRNFLLDGLWQFVSDTSLPSVCVYMHIHAFIPPWFDSWQRKPFFFIILVLLIWDNGWVMLLEMYQFLCLGTGVTDMLLRVTAFFFLYSPSL
jgi:hypothetical protein